MPQRSQNPEYDIISSLFWDVAGRGLVAGYRRFGSIRRSHFKGQAFKDCLTPESAWRLKMDRHVAPRTPVNTLQNTARNTPAEGETSTAPRAWNIVTTDFVPNIWAQWLQNDPPFTAIQELSRSCLIASDMRCLIHTDSDWYYDTQPDYSYASGYCVFCKVYVVDIYWQLCSYNYHHHHHHHHVREGLGVFPVPWSSRWSWSLHLFLGPPMFLRPFGLYCSACFGILFVSILCTCCSHFFWYRFISYTTFCAPVFPPNTLILFFI